MATYILVHGAWHGGWCWRDVIAPLASRGHNVLAPTLTGLAERRHLVSSVEGPDTHVQDIVNLIEFYGLEDVVLVGHSYGGMVITGAASRIPDRIAHLVYLDAFVPEKDVSMIQMVPAARASQLEEAAKLADAVEPTGLHTWTGDPERLKWLQQMTTPQPSKCFTTPISNIIDPTALDVHRTYIWCKKNDPSPFCGTYERYSDHPAWRSSTLECLHDAMVEVPAALAIMLDSCPAD